MLGTSGQGEGMTGAFVASGNARLWVERGGDGPPVVFLHALCADRRMWAAQCAALAAQYRVVAYDRRGAGRTEHADESWSFVGDLRAVLDAVAPDQPAILVGCSQGGRIAIDAALALPERVRALVLVAPAITGAPTPSFTPVEQARVDAMDAAEAKGDVDALNAAEAHAWFDGPAQPFGRVGGDARALFFDMNRTVLSAAVQGTQAAAPPAYDRVGRIGVPTLVAWGDLDFTYIGVNCRYLARSIPRAQAFEMTGVAHLPNLERPDEFNRRLLAFCAAAAG